MGKLIVLQPLFLGKSIVEMEFNWSPFWVQVHGLPIERMTKRNREIIGECIGKLIGVEAHTKGLLLYRDFFCIKVIVDVSQTLYKGFLHKQKDNLNPIDPGFWVSFKYEKLFDFCYDCGRLDHDNNSCKFVARMEGKKAGYGPELRAATARSTGLPLDHFQRQIDETEIRVRRLLRHQTLRTSHTPMQETAHSTHTRREEGRDATIGPLIVTLSNLKT